MEYVEMNKADPKRNILIIFLLAIAMMNLSSCSESVNNENLNNKNERPQNAQQALSRLSSEDKRNFEQWKQELLKSCDAAEAFGRRIDGRSTPRRGVDGVALLEKNQGSMIFSNSSQFLALTSYHPLTGSRTSRINEGTGENNQVSVVSKQEGPLCKIYLFGHKVFETYIVESFTIGALWASDAEIEVRAKRPEIKQLRDDGASKLVDSTFYHLITQGLKSSAQAHELLANNLGLTQEQVQERFRPATQMSLNGVAKIKNLQSAVWNDLDRGLIADGVKLNEYFDGQNHLLPIKIQLHAPTPSFYVRKNQRKVNVHLIMDVEISKDGDSFLYKAESIDLEGSYTQDRDEAELCVETRLVAFLELSSADEILPSVDSIFGTCRKLYSNIKESGYENELMQSLIPLVFANVTPSKGHRYNGWEKVLSRLALQALSEGKNIQEVLDPNRETTIVEVVAEHLQSLKQALSRSREISSRDKNIFYQMGLDWSLRGQHVSRNRIHQIVESIDNAINPFDVSAYKLILDLSERPYSYDQELSFAGEISTVFKQEALRALQLAREIGHSNFSRDVFEKIIQKRVSLQELRDWSKNFENIRVRIKNYPRITHIQNYMVSRSIDWIRSGVITSEELDTIFLALDNTIEHFEGSVNQLLHSLEEDLLANWSTLDFAASLSREYKILAEAIFEQSVVANYGDWGRSFIDSILQNKPKMNQLELLFEMWEATLMFIEDEKIRTQRHSSASSNQRRLERIIDKALKESWSAQEISGVESIAKLAGHRSSCSSHRGLSSRVHCIGLEFFSKNEGMFFDEKFTNRYPMLAERFLEYVTDLSAARFRVIRERLVNAFFATEGPVWSNCRQRAFDEKVSLLDKKIKVLINESSMTRITEHQRRVTETLENCP